MRFLRHTSLTVLARWGGYVLEGLASILVARYTGPAGKGTLAVLNVLTGFAVQAGNLGLHAATVHFTARDPKAAGRVAWAALVLGPAIGVGVAAALGAAVLVFPVLVPEIPRLLLAIGLAGIPFAFLLLFFQSILLGQQRILAFNGLDVGGKAVALVVVVVTVCLWGGGVRELFIAGFFVSSAAAVLATMVAFRRVADPFVWDGGLLRHMLSYGFRSYLSCLLAFLIVRSDMLVLNYFRGPAEAGVYAVAVNLGDLLLTLPTAAGTMLFPRISANAGDDGALTASVARHTMFIMAGLCLVAGLVAWPAVPLVYGARFTRAVPAFLLLLPGVLVLSVEMILMNDLAGRGLPAVVIAIPGVGLALNVLLNFTLVPRFGLLAASASSSLSYVVMGVLAWGAFARRTAVPLRSCCLITGSDVRTLWDRLGATRGDG